MYSVDVDPCGSLDTPNTSTRSKCMQVNRNRSYFGIRYITMTRIMTLMTSLSTRTSGQPTDWLVSVASPSFLKISRNASSCPSFTVSSRANHGSDGSAWRKAGCCGEDESHSLERQVSHSSSVFDVFFPYPVNLILAEYPLRWVQ